MSETTKTYKGTKIVNAKPMTRQDYNDLRGWALPADEDGADAGYLVEYTDGGKPNLAGFSGYVSWSPAQQFENAYKEILPIAGEEIEQEIIAKGKTAPRITPHDIEMNIASEHYFTAGEGVIGAFAAAEMQKAKGDAVVPAGAAHPDLLRPSLNLLTFCVLVLRNGFTVTGESACASPENFDAEIGRTIARKNAVDKIWPLMGYELRSTLHKQAMTQRDCQIRGVSNATADPQPVNQ